MSKITKSEKLFVNTEYDCNNLSIMRLPSPEELKVVIWDKELCNGAEWNDFLKCVEEKSEENAELKKQLAITEKALELAVEDKCFAENCIAESFIGKGAKVRVPRKEQYYLEKAKEMLENE